MPLLTLSKSWSDCLQRNAPWNTWYLCQFRAWWCRWWELDPIRVATWFEGCEPQGTWRCWPPRCSLTGVAIQLELVGGGVGPLGLDPSLPRGLDDGAEKRDCVVCQVHHANLVPLVEGDAAHRSDHHVHACSECCCRFLHHHPWTNLFAALERFNLV